MSDFVDLTGYWTEERRARLALNRVVEAGTPVISDYVDRYGAADTWERVKSWTGDDRWWAQRAAGINIDQLIEQTDEVWALRFIMPGDDEWPDTLNQLRGLELDGRGGVPVGLWLRGPGDLLDTRSSVAIVGSRSSTRYGEIVATELANDLAEQGTTIISGGAYGIDTCAHRGALAADGFTIGIFSQGLDNAYPRGNTGLYERLATEHLVVSEAPPGTPPSPQGFIARNRLIAALAQATVVVEAAERSGARNTVAWAEQLGRVVMAVPGPVTSATSVTPNRLIRDQKAVLVTGAQDVRTQLDALGVHDRETPAVETPTIHITRSDPAAPQLVLADSWFDTQKPQSLDYNPLLPLDTFTDPQPELAEYSPSNPPDL